MDFTSLCISRQTKPPNSEHEAFLVYIIEKNLTSKFYAIMLTHHTVVAIHFRGLFFKFQRVRFLFLWVCTFGGPLLKLLDWEIWCSGWRRNEQKELREHQIQLRIEFSHSEAKCKKTALFGRFFTIWGFSFWYGICHNLVK